MSAPHTVAVVGSGVAGLTAAYVASRSASVTLYEADDRLGGHADTHLVAEGADGLGIDTGFIVHNERTYPTLLRLFRELGVETQPSEMSLSVRDDVTGLEYAGALGPRGLFPAGRNAARPAYLRMLIEIPRFHRHARRLLPRADDDLTALRARPLQQGPEGNQTAEQRDEVRRVEAEPELVHDDEVAARNRSFHRACRRAEGAEEDDDGGDEEDDGHQETTKETFDHRTMVPIRDQRMRLSFSQRERSIWTPVRADRTGSTLSHDQ